VKTIGTIATYVGTEIPGYAGSRVRIFAVLRDALRPDVDIDADGFVVSDDEELTRFGGVTENDRLEVAHIRKDGSTSFVHCNPRAVDLECFAALNVACN
jgi:hypothetical protein